MQTAKIKAGETYAMDRRGDSLNPVVELGPNLRMISNEE